MHPDRLHRSPRLARRPALVFLASLGLLTLFYLAVGFNIPYNADDAAPMLMAQAVFSGNPLLTGWNLGNHAFLTTELPFYALGALLLGLTPKTLYVVVAFQWALVSTLLIFAAAQAQDGTLSELRLLCALCLAMFVANFLAEGQDLLAGSHLGAYALSLVCLLLLRPIERGADWPAYCAYGSLVTLTLVGDLVGIVTIVLPVAAVCVFRITRGDRGGPALPLLVATAGAAALAALLLGVLAAAGAGQVPGPGLGLVPLHQLGDNLRITVLAALNLLGVRGLGASGGGPELAGVIRLSLLLILLAASAPALARLGVASLRDQVLAAIVVCSGLAFTLSTLPANGIDGRYLLPALIFGSILIARNLPIAESRRVPGMPSLAICLALAAALLPPLALSPPPTPVDSLAQFLLEKQLGAGYGPYWSAANTTLAASGRVRVRPVYSFSGETVQPFQVLADEAWYREPARFVVLDTRDAKLPTISRQQVLNTFGEPAAEYDLGRYAVLVWEHALVSPEGWELRFERDRMSVHGSALWTLPRHVGLLRSTELVSDGRPGFLLFGPYRPLEPGAYNLTVYGRVAQLGPQARVDVASSSLGVQFALLPFSASSDKPGVIAQGLVELSEPVEDLQIRIHVGAEDHISVGGYELLQRP